MDETDQKRYQFANIISAKTCRDTKVNDLVGVACEDDSPCAGGARVRIGRTIGVANSSSAAWCIYQPIVDSER